MGLFDVIRGAIDDPEKEANTNQIGGILDTIQQLSSEKEAPPTAIESAMSIVGKYVKPALKQKQEEEGEEKVQSIINQFGGTQASEMVVNMLFSNPAIKNTIAQEISQKTGLPEFAVMPMIPKLVPMVLDLLKSGNDPNKNALASNPVAKKFLDADGDGDIDMWDALQMAKGYMGK